MKYSLNQLIEQYTDKNNDNLYEPVAVGKYGIRKRTDIYMKELSDDYSRNKVIYKDTMTIGMGSKQIDFGVLLEDSTYSVSPAYTTFKINTSIICSEYLDLFLEKNNSYYTQKYMIASARQGKKVDIANLLNEEIDVPTVDKQMEVIKNISIIKSAKEKDVFLLQLMDELVKTRFYELFGDPLHPKRFKKLGEIALLERGRFSPRPRNDPKYFNGDYPFIQTGDISSSNHRLTDYKQTLNELGIKVSKKFGIGTIVMAIVGATIGATAILEREVYAPDSVIGITPYTYNNVFLETLLQFWKSELLANAPECARPNINLSILSEVPIIEANIEVQNSFAEIVKEVDKSKLAVQKRIELYEELLNKKMSEYFIY
jgi:type I restriction enzyme S subunit